PTGFIVLWVNSKTTKTPFKKENTPPPPPKNFEKFLKNKGAGNLTFPAPFTLPIQETSKVYSGNCLKIN
ncbi:hypothetical protein, partial [Rothia mucilaginosa]|uniref:hypothetical protein n=1 Tax=Rothia mucilaginosa TaxID=43675 RepID=UPI0028F018D2